MSARALQSYSNVKVNAGIESASSHRLILMLFDGFLERIAQAKGAIQRGDIETRGNRISSAISIVLGLKDSLNVEAGGEMAQNLELLYDYVQRTLMKAHQTNSVELLDECGQLIGNVSSAWREIGRQQ